MHSDSDMGIFHARDCSLAGTNVTHWSIALSVFVEMSMLELLYCVLREAQFCITVQCNILSFLLSLEAN